MTETTSTPNSASEGGPESNSRSAKHPASTAHQRFNRTTVLSFVLFGMLAVAAVAYFAFDVTLLNGQLGVLAALGAISLFLVGQFIRFRQRISLRTMLIIIAVLAAGLAYVGRRLADTQAETDAVDTLVELGAQATFGTETNNDDYFETEGGWYLPIWTRDLLGASFFSNVQHLQLRSPQIKDRHLPLLAEIRQLESLGLSNSSITAEGISNMPLVRGVNSVDINWQQISPESAARLAEFPELESLHIDFRPRSFVANAVGSDFTLLREFRQLKHLIVDVTDLDPDEMETLARLPMLRFLGLKYSQGGALDFSGLSELRDSQSLKSISIPIRAFGDSDLDLLSGARSLESIHLYNTSVTADGVRAFRTANPGIRVLATPPIPGLDDPRIPRPRPEMAEEDQ